MKKVLCLLTGSFLFILQAEAQITITANDIAPVGVTALQATDTMPDASIQPGSAGLQSWNFSALNVHDTLTFEFEEASNTPYANLFPSANLAALQDSLGYGYFVLDNQSLRVLGSYGTLNYDTFSVEAKVNLQPPQTIIRFPATLGDNYSETVKQIVQIPTSVVNVPFGDSVRAVTVTHRSINIDAYGNMTTPTGTYDVIRSTETEISNDSVFVMLSGIWQLIDNSGPDTVINYNWWTNQNDLGFPVVNLTYTPGNGDTDVTWLLDFTSDAGEQIHGLSFTLLPNPAKDWLNVQLAKPFEGRIELFDFNGKKCAGKVIQGTSEILDLKGRSAGVYVVVLKNSRGKVSASRKVQIQ